MLTVTRTSCEPAWASRATWIAVASASAVSVFVIDWTTIGMGAADEDAADVDADTVGRRRGRRASVAARRGRDASVPPDRIRTMSKPLTQIRNANRKTNPTT